MHAPGTVGILLIVLVGLLLFGPSKLPELGRAFGRTLREFKNGAKEMMADDSGKLPNGSDSEAEGRKSLN
ncbi:twin-arginine translocase TatA/TatE family subunit [Cohnella phaseoli]|uniref:Sec-independent protein translocase protein TatA n=1 Tax=Cohnella phaseoli TaxID=456490 RepID=A0A3D9IP85_9BACL|nr:twin-arginine translocase TatA/TatE family subunit [Cohnella phaseoli]RED63561.1 sec-independent protein translocase protein TatA [Cohnella phaseoli]